LSRYSKTLTYDQGKEMANHHSMAQATGMRISFAYPRSPRQRGSNENTNGLLRHYFSNPPWSLMRELIHAVGSESAAMPTVGIQLH
jgi:transposase InsO family protein